MRKANRIQWGLLGEWWCVPLDQTEKETEVMLAEIRKSLGSDFRACPSSQIRDRLYGGFKCGEDEAHRHVYFATGQYSFLAALEGRFWPNDGRDDMWANLRETNADNFIGDGPFTGDMGGRDG